MMFVYWYSTGVSTYLYSCLKCRRLGEKDTEAEAKAEWLNHVHCNNIDLISSI